MSICHYCDKPAVFRATSRTSYASVQKAACREHVDQARIDCAVVCPPTIVEVGQAPR